LWLADALVDARTYAPHHQHLRVARLDAHLDGPENAVQMRESVSVPLGLDSPYGTAGAQHAELRRTEAGGGQDYARESQRGWRVTNPSARNDLGTSVAYRRPVMSAGVVSFWPKPSGSFDRNPASDVLPPTDHCTTTGGQQGRQR
jgi:primary-amine oxidase